MTTPLDIISRALKDIGALEAGESPTADTGAATLYNATNASTTADDWKTEITVYFRESVRQSINIVSNDASICTTQSQLNTKDPTLYNLLVELEAQVANVADTMTLDGLILDRF